MIASRAEYRPIRSRRAQRPVQVDGCRRIPSRQQPRGAAEFIAGHLQSTADTAPLRAADDAQVASAGRLFAGKLPPARTTRSNRRMVLCESKNVPCIVVMIFRSSASVFHASRHMPDQSLVSSKDVPGSVRATGKPRAARGRPQTGSWNRTARVPGADRGSWSRRDSGAIDTNAA